MSVFDVNEIEKFYQKYTVAPVRKPNLPEEITPIFYSSVPFGRCRTNTFAYLGVPPKKNSEPTAKFPAVVLVHGGNGKAESDWVKAWVDRGYVAIAMDLNAQMYAESAYGEFSANPKGGPHGYGSFEQMEKQIRDTWVYHSVANVLLARKQLEELSFVDANRIGIAGISWGGFVTYLTAGICSKFAFCSISYTMAYLYEDPMWRNMGLTEDKMGTGYRKWLENFDPSRYIANIQAPTLLIRGADDIAFSTKLFNKTVELFHAPVFLAQKPHMPHDQNNGANQKEIFYFADSMVNNGQKLVQGRLLWGDENSFSLKLNEGRAVCSAALVWSSSESEDAYVWEWQTVSMEKKDDGTYFAELPEEWRRCYALMADAAGNQTSTLIIER